MSRKLALAMRCQLLTGSFEGNERCCPCESPKQCCFTKEERDFWKKHLKILETAESQWEEYEKLKETHEQVGDNYGT